MWFYFFFSGMHSVILTARLFAFQITPMISHHWKRRITLWPLYHPAWSPWTFAMSKFATKWIRSFWSQILKISAFLIPVYYINKLSELELVQQLRIHRKRQSCNRFKNKIFAIHQLNNIKCNKQSHNNQKHLLCRAIALL